jgi:hypothetical protein
MCLLVVEAPLHVTMCIPFAICNLMGNGDGVIAGFVLTADLEGNSEWPRNEIMMTLSGEYCISSTPYGGGGMRHYATIRKFAGSIPDEVIGFFNYSNRSSRTMAPGSNRPLTEMCTRNVPGGKGWPARKADKLTAICEPNV